MQSEGAKRPLLCGREGGDSVPPLLYVVVPRQLNRVVLGTHRRGKIPPCSLNVRNVPCFVAGGSAIPTILNNPNSVANHQLACSRVCVCVQTKSKRILRRHEAMLRSRAGIGITCTIQPP